MYNIEVTPEQHCAMEQGEDALKSNTLTRYTCQIELKDMPENPSWVGCGGGLYYVGLDVETVESRIVELEAKIDQMSEYLSPNEIAYLTEQEGE